MVDTTTKTTNTTETPLTTAETTVGVTGLKEDGVPGCIKTANTFKAKLKRILDEAELEEKAPLIKCLFELYPNDILNLKKVYTNTPDVEIKYTHHEDAYISSLLLLTKQFGYRNTSELSFQPRGTIYRYHKLCEEQENTIELRWVFNKEQQENKTENKTLQQIRKISHNLSLKLTELSTHRPNEKGRALQKSIHTSISEEVNNYLTEIEDLITESLKTQLSEQTRTLIHQASENAQNFAIFLLEVLMLKPDEHPALQEVHNRKFIEICGTTIGNKSHHNYRIPTPEAFMLVRCAELIVEHEEQIPEEIHTELFTTAERLQVCPVLMKKQLKLNKYDAQDLVRRHQASIHIENHCKEGNRSIENIAAQLAISHEETREIEQRAQQKITEMLRPMRHELLAIIRGDVPDAMYANQKLVNELLSSPKNKKKNIPISG
jgi:succinate dehydrogenase flavin-adding protein (antitoxin of CptAB toxin-antitoxin module)